MADDSFKKSYACMPDAEDAIKAFQKKTKNACYKADLKIVPITVDEKIRGRKPKIPREKKTVTRYRVKVCGTIPDVPRIEQFKRSEESFVLITNVP
ncbi:MAG: hypothetical protein WC406_11590 [Methanoregula sp.]